MEKSKFWKKKNLILYLIGQTLIEKNCFLDIKFFLHFFIFFQQQKITAGQKIIVKFQDFHSQFLLNDFDFWQFSRDSGYVRVSGKFRNPPILHPGGLCKWWKQNFPKPRFSTFGVFTKYRCCNPSKWPQMPQKWVNTIPFGPGHTLGTLNHGLESLFYCFLASNVA